ncbi:hypothetical protein [Mesorhizobium sp. L-8-3]|uniref:hypothetical protein n=1 Tax=Mesorhizobium sp. L-8-3 TaxID=2744522 RepID=UPI001928AEC6|nr:hypothetical protein [Mesorhizobium sp. L-8-3]BCH22044.1 hypothetical protein MesoLjLb_18290 [Mesorhizobium sp. L-8-3]
MTSSLAPWLAIAGLGAFHGLNPAMGWLFAVALGMHRKSRATVFASLGPIILGHALAVAAVLAAVLAFGIVIDHGRLGPLAGAVLIGWAAWHLAYGHRRRVRIGMQTGFLGLAIWSLLMASAHGAGLMLLPVVMPLCLSGTPAAGITAQASIGTAFAALGVHTGAMLAVIAAISVLVYEWLGLEFLRRSWINLDYLWSAALVASGALLVVW